MKVIITIIVLFFCFNNSAFAYFDNYPPFKFSEKPPKSIKVEVLVDVKNFEYKSKDGQVIARLKEDADSFDFILKDGAAVLAHFQKRSGPFPYEVYAADLNNDGLGDFILFSTYRGSGLGAFIGITDIFLKKPDGTYQDINYESFAPEARDFVDLNNDGKCEIIIMDMSFIESKKNGSHNYFFYNVYEIVNYKLVNVSRKFKGFPKFIWHTDKKNDQDTTHLTAQEKARYASEEDKKIKYLKLPVKGGE